MDWLQILLGNTLLYPKMSHQYRCIKHYLIVRIPNFYTTYKGYKHVEINMWALHHKLVIFLQSVWTTHLFPGQSITLVGYISVWPKLLKPVEIIWSKASLSKIHWPLSINQPSSILPLSVYPSNQIHLAALGLPRQYNKDGAWLPRDFGRLGLNLFNQPLSPQIIWLLRPKTI